MSSHPGQSRHPNESPRIRPVATAAALLCIVLAATACRDQEAQSAQRSAPRAMGMGELPPSPPAPTGSTAVDQFGGFDSPSRLAMTRKGVLYVSDTRRGVVATLDGSGRRIGTISGLGRPLGVAVFEPPKTDSMTVCQICVPRGRSLEKPGAAKKERWCHPVARGVERRLLAGRRLGNKWCQTVPATGVRVYVGDDANGSVTIFERGVAVGHLGAGAGEFRMPNAIAVTSDGIAYVVDSRAKAVKVYDHRGKPQGAFGSSLEGGRLGFPTDIAINESRGEVYVTDFIRQRVVVYDQVGRWVQDITAPANEAGDPIFFRPLGIGLGPTGNLYVVDNALGCVAILDPAGNLLGTIGYRDGRYWTGDLNLPIDAVTDGERVYVSSNGAGRVSVFEVSP